MSRVSLRIGSALKRSASAKAFAFVGFIALAQFVLIGGMVAAQRDTAHILDINGAQRMRTQQIAFLAQAARTVYAPRDWRAEMHRAINELLVVRRELLGRRDVLPNSVDATGETVLSRAVLRYANAARVVERDPRDVAAFAYIVAHRTPLLAAEDGSVKGRTLIFEGRNAQLIDGLLIGLGAMLLTMALVWARIVEPNERRTVELVAKLNGSEAQMRSLFAENPDSIVMYDTNGSILRGNRASRALLGPMTGGPLGTHFLSHIAPSEKAVVARVFSRALGGESVSFDTVFVDSRGERIDVHANLFPNVVDCKTVGVIGVAKDTRALRRAEAAYLVQAERITELYRVAAFQNRSWKLQLDETLTVAAQRLGYDWAVATEIVAGDARAVALAGDAGFPHGDPIALPKALVQIADCARDVWSIDDLSQSSLRNEPFIRSSLWAALLGIPIAIGSSTYGALILGSALTRTTTFEAADGDFLRLVSTLVAASVQRGQYERQLDTLAFFDALTGLPNRVLLAERMTEVLRAASQRKVQFAVHYLDLDFFKEVNDTFGHAAGDEVLRAAARRMSQCIRESDTVARIGGDEFVIVQALDPSGRGANELAERVLAALAKPFRFGTFEHNVGVSIGISVFPVDGVDAATLLRTADEALLRAKRAGRNRQMFAVA